MRRAHSSLPFCFAHCDRCTRDLAPMRLLDAPNRAMMIVTSVRIPSYLEAEPSKVTYANARGANSFIVQIVALVEPIFGHSPDDVDRHPSITRLGIRARCHARNALRLVRVQIVRRHDVPQHVIVIGDLTMIVGRDLASLVTWRRCPHDPGPRNTQPRKCFRTTSVNWSQSSLDNCISDSAPSAISTRRATISKGRAISISSSAPFALHSS